MKENSSRAEQRKPSLRQSHISEELDTPNRPDSRHENPEDNPPRSISNGHLPFVVLALIIAYSLVPKYTDGHENAANDGEHHEEVRERPRFEGCRDERKQEEADSKDCNRTNPLNRGHDLEYIPYITY